MIRSTKIPTGPTGKSGPPQKVDSFFRNVSGWTEQIHLVLGRNFRKFWLNGSRPLLLVHMLYYHCIYFIMFFYCLVSELRASTDFRDAL